MFTNFIYFIIVLLIYSTYQPPEETNFDAPETAILFASTTLAFAILCQLQFKRIEKRSESQSVYRSDRQFNGVLARMSVMAIVLFAVDIHVLNLPSFFVDIGLFATIPTLLALLFLSLFVAYLCIVWATAHGAFESIYGGDTSLKSYVSSNVSSSVPVLFPWLALSAVSDIVFALPFQTPKAILSTTWGQVGYFLLFLVLVSVLGPAMIKSFWRCESLEPGLDRERIERLCQRAELKFADIVYWPIFGGKMITAGVMGLVKKFRYILVTDALLEYLSPLEIDAVISHEIGHVKKNHILFYLGFFAGYMLLTFATFDLIVFAVVYAEPFFALGKAAGFDQSSAFSILMSVSVIVIFLVYFRFIFGYFMRNFERQADCYVYALFDSALPLITTLEKIAATSGSPPDRPNWHHFSISERIDYLKKCEKDRSWVARQNAKIKKSIAVYLAGMLLAGATGYALNFSDAGKRFNSRFFERIILNEIEKEPENARLHGILGDIYFSRKNYEGVRDAYETSLYLNSDNPQVLNNLAWLYATCEDESFRNYPRALVLAKMAANLDRSPHILDTLAQSYYVNGKLDLAVETAELALKLAQQDRQYFEKQLRKFKTEPPPGE